MHYKSKIHIYFILFAAVLIASLYSCESHVINKKLQIHNSSLGDTLTDDFEIIKKYGPNFSIARYMTDSTLRAYTINNRISNFYLSQPSNEYKKSLKRFSKIIGPPIIHYIGDTLNGVKLIHNIELHKWVDTNTYSEYLAYTRIDTIGAGYISVSNDSISKFLIDKIIVEDEMETENLELVIFD